MADQASWRKQIAALDRYGRTHWDRSKQPGFFKLFWATVSHSGDGPISLVLMGAAFVFAPVFWRNVILTLLAADLLTAVVVRIVKVRFKRPRPEGDWGKFYRKADPHSFPSGHAGRGGAFGLTSLLVAPLWLGSLVLLWGVLVAASRVAMGVHFVSDVVVGFTIGCTVSLLVVLGRTLLL